MLGVGAVVIDTGGEMCVLAAPGREEGGWFNRTTEQWQHEVYFNDGDVLSVGVDSRG